MIWQKYLIRLVIIGLTFLLNLKSSECISAMPPQQQSISNSIESTISLGDGFLRIADFDSAIHYFKKAGIISISAKDTATLILSNLKLAECYMDMKEFDSCINYLNKLQFLMQYAELNDTLNKLNYYHVNARYYSRIGNSDSSDYFVKKALSVLNKTNQYDSVKVLILKLKGNNYLRSNQFDQALQYYENALLIEKNRTPDTTIGLSTLFGNMGIVYSLQGMHFKAEKMFIESLQIKEKLLDSLDPVLARAYVNFGRLKIIGGENDIAINYFNKAERIYLNKFGEDNFNNGLLYFNKGAAYINKKDFEKALSYHEKSIEVYSKYLDRSNPEFGRIYGNMGLIYRKLNKYRLSIEYYKKSLELVTGPTSIPIGYRNLAECYKSLEVYDSALFNFQKALDKSIELSGPVNLQSGTSYRAIGEFYDEIGDWKKAEVHLFKALRIFIEVFGETNIDVSITYLSIGNHYQNMNQYNDALKYYQKFLIASGDHYYDSNYLHNPDIYQLEYEYNTVINMKQKAKALIKLYSEITKDQEDLKASYESSKLGIALFEEIRKSLMTEDDKLYLTNDINSLYSLHVLTALDLYDISDDEEYLNQAFIYSEKSKASVLLSSIKELEATDLSSIPDSLRTLEKKLKKDISIVEHFLYEENSKRSPDNSKIKTWNNKLFSLQRKYERLISKLENEYPDYFQLKYNINVLGIKDIQDIINDDVLIEYFHADSVLIVFYITNEKVGYTRAFLNEDYIANIKEFIELTHNPPKIDDSKHEFERFSNSSYNLYCNLIQPVEEIISSSNNLLIIPDGMLGYIPFEALIASPPNPGAVDYRGLHYLINSYQIRYSYSASLLYNNVKKKRTRGKLLAFAPEYSVIENSSVDSVNSQLSFRNSLKPLDYNIAEVEGIYNIVGGDVNIGDQANVKTFKEMAQDYSILHLAMHAIINDEEPLASKLAFAAPDDHSGDGFLNAYEIYNMRLNAQMVVLSACQTGAGSLSRGEGIMSMARGFFYAGVPGIVMTLWEIEDESSLRIMLDFYGNIDNNMKKDEALQIAKRNYFQSSPQLYAHPYYWAAFVQIGNNSSIAYHSIYTQRIFLSLAMILMIAAIILIRRKRSANQKKQTNDSVI